MNQIVRVVAPPRSFPSERLAEAARDVLVREMAHHLVAGKFGGLDLASDCDVVAYLRNTPQQYRWVSEIKPCLDDALAEAHQILIAAEMSEG